MIVVSKNGERAVFMNLDHIHQKVKEALALILKQAWHIEACLEDTDLRRRCARIVALAESSIDELT